MLQSVKGKVQSATEGTNYCAPGGEFQTVAQSTPEKLEFPNVPGPESAYFGNHIPDIPGSYQSHVSSCFQLASIPSSTPGMRMNMSRLLQQKKALEKGLAESLGPTDFILDSLWSVRTPATWENDDPSRGTALYICITRCAETES